ELTYHELKDRGMENSELMIYGRVPMMISAGCIYRNAGDDKCMKNDTGRMSGLKAGDMKHTVRLTDRMKTDFPVICDCRYCYNIIFNSVPVSLHDEADKVIKLDPLALRLYFTTEKPEEAAEISEYFLRIFCRGDNSHGVEKPPCRAYTKGHFSRAVL
ncbi:MAG: hypothetical protein J5966_09355, partial [Lachnospiraceae bacterium]|nr:hypothetical protein [Lachnospiraceae bacterium]